MQKYKIILKTEEKIEDTKLLSRGVNKQVVNWFSKGNYEIMNQIKTENQIKPISIDFLHSEKTGIFELELNIAQDNLLLEKALTKGLDESDEVFELNYKKFSLVGYKKEDNILIKDLFEKTNELYQEIEINFLTETSFVRRGLNSEECLGEYPFPDPAKIFESIISKFNTFYDIKVDKIKVLEDLNKYFFIKEAKVNANTFSLGFSKNKHTYITGFVGNLVLAKKTKDINISKTIAFLAKYGEWCGVGKKTFFGLGKISVNLI